MIEENGEYYVFEDYTDEDLNQRIAYWETVNDKHRWDVLECMYKERDRRVDHHLLAWVESK